MEVLKKGIPIWGPNNQDFDSTAWINVIKDFEDNKRQNPIIFKVQDDDKHLQVDHFRGGYFAYELEKDKVWAFDKAASGGNDPGLVIDADDFGAFAVDAHKRAPRSIAVRVTAHP